MHLTAAHDIAMGPWTLPAAAQVAVKSVLVALKHPAAPKNPAHRPADLEEEGIAKSSSARRVTALKGADGRPKAARRLSGKSSLVSCSDVEQALAANRGPGTGGTQHVEDPLEGEDADGSLTAGRKIHRQKRVYRWKHVCTQTFIYLFFSK